MHLPEIDPFVSRRERSRQKDQTKAAQARSFAPFEYFARQPVFHPPLLLRKIHHKGTKTQSSIPSGILNLNYIINIFSVSPLCLGVFVVKPAASVRPTP